MSKDIEFQTEFYFKKLMEAMEDGDRYSWIKDTLRKYDIAFEEQNFNGLFTNIICKGTSDIWVSAHYDTVNIKYCANDNTASVINLLNLKVRMPEINVVFLDAEEPPHMGQGSTYFSKYIKENNIPCKYVLNLELTGYGNCICIGTRGSEIIRNALMSDLDNFSDFYLSDIDTPFSDTDIFLKNGVPSILLMLLQVRGNNLLSESMYHCHTPKDTMDKINYDDMNKLVSALVFVLSKESE